MIDEETQKSISEAIKKMEEDQEKFWDSLSKEDQLKAFCAIIRRIHKAELQDGGSYRHCLYSVFNFGPESYLPAQVAGYLDIHNAIFTHEELQEELKTLKNQQLT